MNLNGMKIEPPASNPSRTHLLGSPGKLCIAVHGSHSIWRGANSDMPANRVTKSAD